MPPSLYGWGKSDTESVSLPAQGHQVVSDQTQTKTQAGRRVDETTMAYLQNGILFSHKKEESFTLCDSMDGPGEPDAK